MKKLFLLPFLVYILFFVACDCENCDQYTCSRNPNTPPKTIIVPKTETQDSIVASATTKNLIDSLAEVDSVITIPDSLLDKIIIQANKAKEETDKTYTKKNSDIQRITIIVARKINECIRNRQYELKMPFIGIENVSDKLKEAIVKIFEKKGYKVSVYTKDKNYFYKISWKDL